MFPVYIVHQTLIVVLAVAFARWQWPVGIEAAALVAATFAASLLCFELVRRIAWLRPWFGLARAERARRPRVTSTAATAVPR